MKIIEDRIRKNKYYRRTKIFLYITSTQVITDEEEKCLGEVPKFDFTSLHSKR